jgi:hypothetical protein
MRLDSPSRVALSLALVACVIAGALLFWAATRDDGTNWNPLLRTFSEVEGDWVAESTVLKVRDGMYECSGAGCGDLGGGGTWLREGDFYVKASPRSQEPQLLRLGLRGTELIVAADAGPGDPDLWNPKVKFTRARPWSPSPEASTPAH